jgi:hypothetical protein
VLSEEADVKDSGKREDFATGARRDQRVGKGRYDLIAPEFLRRLALIMEAGAAKYGDRNWEKGIPISRSFDSLQRHLWQFMAGQDDEDHLGHAAANLMFIITTLDRISQGRLDPDLDDLPLELVSPDPEPEDDLDDYPEDDQWDEEDLDEDCQGSPVPRPPQGPGPRLHQARDPEGSRRESHWDEPAGKGVWSDGATT